MNSKIVREATVYERWVVHEYFIVSESRIIHFRARPYPNYFQRVRRPKCSDRFGRSMGAGTQSSNIYYFFSRFVYLLRLQYIQAVWCWKRINNRKTTVLRIMIQNKRLNSIMNYKMDTNYCSLFSVRKNAMIGSNRNVCVRVFFLLFDIYDLAFPWMVFSSSFFASVEFHVVHISLPIVLHCLLSQS